jgi:hypothetical protein
MTYTDRYHRLSEQESYERAARARGLVALLEPYSTRTPSVPRQRTKDAETLPSVGVSG